MKKELFAIYLRKSRKDLEIKDYDVLERHRRILLDFANSRNIKINKEDIYEEIVSGETIQDRPVIQELLKKIEVGYYKAVLVMEIERLARGNTIDQGIITQTFQLTNTLIITPNKTYDTNNEYDNEFLEFGLFMSRREYKAISRRIQTGRIQSVKEGNYIGSITPYGYDKERLEGAKGYKLIPNPEEAENVKLIFKLFIEIKGTTTLAYKLNDLGIVSRTGSVWTAAMVRNILKNRVYIGFVSWGKRANVKKLNNNEVNKSRPINNNYLEAKGKHEPLIDEATFYTVQELLKSSSIKKVPSEKVLKNPLSGLIKCGKCHNNMIRRPYQKNNCKDTLICRNKYCDNVSSFLDLIEKHLLESLEQQLEEFYFYINNYEQEYIKSTKNYNLQIKKIDNEINKLKKQLSKACEFLELGTYSLELFKERSGSINFKIENLEKEKVRLKELSKNNVIEKVTQYIPLLENCLNTYWGLDVEGKNTILKKIIKEVYYIKNAKGGRWNKDDLNKFSLDIKLRM
ncbi:recombinase family protein [uncultured Clostridium sp.]|uniref:recombinase family protein n=1 Tax=uncultured Clostridium sp. TaxID=59620 RepID=UPI0026291BB5|nr:recombinase family protein [uncultured Clostridium sp.]